jgi:hypothetical protein
VRALTTTTPAGTRAMTSRKSFPATCIDSLTFEAGLTVRS